MTNEHTQPAPSPALTPAERQAQIIKLAASALDGAERTRRQARRSVSEALECGRLLIQEKNAAGAANVRWGVWFTNRFAKVLPERTARAWMELARRADELHEPQPNIQRRGVLALGLMPNKSYPAVADTPTIKLPCNYLLPLMRLDRACAALRQYNPRGLEPEQAARVLRDLRHVLAFAEWLKQTRSG